VCTGGLLLLLGGKHGSLNGLALAKLAVLGTTGLSLIGDLLLLLLLGFGAPDILHQVLLALEHVTLGLEIEFLVEVLVNLLAFTILAQQSSEDTLASNPKALRRCAGLGSTTALSGTSVTSLAFGSQAESSTGATVNYLGLANNEPILDQLAHVLARVGQGNIAALIGVQPDFPLTTLQHAGGEALLQAKGHHLL